MSLLHAFSVRDFFWRCTWGFVRLTADFTPGYLVLRLWRISLVSFALLAHLAGVFRPCGDSVNPTRWAEPIEKGKYRIHLGETSAPMMLEVLHPDFLIGFLETFETTAALQTGMVRMTLPTPGTVNAVISTNTSEPVTLRVEARKMVDYNDEFASEVTVFSKVVEASVEAQSVEIGPLAPAEHYYLSGSAVSPGLERGYGVESCVCRTGMSNVLVSSGFS